MSDTKHKYELVLELVLDAPRENIWRCWTEAELLEQWFTPKPFTTEVESIDLRPGGANVIIMRGPNGEEIRNVGVYLEVVPNHRLVFTDAYTEAWLPSEKPFMTGEIVLKDGEGGKTRYRATARHWSAEDQRSHEEMGFREGWTQAARQLEDVAKSL